MRISPRSLRLCGIFIFLLSNIISSGQDIFVRTFTTTDSVMIRWVPSTVETWKLGNKNGYIVERFLQPDYPNGPSTLLSVSPILPLPKTDTTWNKLIRVDKINGFVFESIYGATSTNPNSEKRKLEEQTKFGFALKAGDLSVETAKAEGLYFCDNSIIKGAIYVYKISLAKITQTTTVKPGIAIADEKSSILFSPEKLRADFRNKKVAITFDIISTRERYAGYIIERSEDSLHFTRINANLLTFAKSQYEQTKTELVYQDSLPANHKTYWYRVRGFSYFGLTGPPSAIVKGKGREEWTVFPIIDTLYSPDNKRIEMKWHLSENIDSTFLKTFLVLRAAKADGPYEFLNTKSINKTNFSFTDSNPLFGNYFVIAAISTENDTGFSFSYFIELQDNDPPPVPQKLSGIIDTNGIVKLYWEKVEAQDLKGYRIFRANSLQEEFYEVSDSILRGNYFVDTITTQTLTRNVYYCVRSVDRMYNNSKNSSPCLLKRVDKIPPVAPVVKYIIHTDSTIQLTWFNSSSDDIMCVELIRKNSFGDIIQLSSWSGKDTVQHFTDFLVTVENIYNYSIVVTDSSGNKSALEFPSIQFQPRIYPGLKQFKALPDFSKRNITLSWEAPTGTVDSYIIYKSKKGEQMRTWKTVKGNINAIIDKELYPGNTYEYGVKAIMKNGAETKFVDIEVVF